METAPELMGRPAQIRENSTPGRLQWVLPDDEGPHKAIMTAELELTTLARCTMVVGKQSGKSPGRSMWEICGYKSVTAWNTVYVQPREGVLNNGQDRQI